MSKYIYENLSSTEKERINFETWQEILATLQAILKEGTIYNMKELKNKKDEK